MADLIDSTSARKVREATAPLVGIADLMRGRGDDELAYIGVGTVRKILVVLCEVGIGQVMSHGGNALGKSAARDLPLSGN